MKVLARVGPIANGMFVARGDLGAAEIDALKKALASINTDPAGQPALKAAQVAKWAPADDRVFNPVRSAAKVLGLNLQAFSQKK